MSQYPPGIFSGHGGLNSQGKSSGTLPHFLTSLATEMSVSVLDASGGIDAAADPYAQAPQDEARPRLVVVDTSGGVVTITLPLAADSDKRAITFVRMGGSNAVIDGAGAETISGAASVTLAADYDSVTVVCANGEWLTISRIGV